MFVPKSQPEACVRTWGEVGSNAQILKLSFQVSGEYLSFDNFLHLLHFKWLSLLFTSYIYKTRYFRFTAFWGKLLFYIIMYQPNGGNNSA